jgi:DNA-binding MarR family transcriptional regulator
MAKQPISKLTSGINRCTLAYVDRALQRYRLGSGTYPVLLCLQSRGGINQNRLSEELSVDKAWTARAVKHLCDLGYVEKEADPLDSRACRLSLTEQGRDLVPRIRAVLGKWNELLGEGLDEEERDCADRCLGRIWENAKRYRAAGTQGDDRT